MKRAIHILLFSFCLLSLSAQIKVGAEQTEEYFPTIKGKNIALVVNQTSMIHNLHLLDVLVNEGFNVKKVFAPEHGFRGTADAGEKVDNTIDHKTGIPLISIYGKNKKPSTEQLSDIDIVIFDIQDVGARFYTYISTMHYVMESCAESNKSLIILDRPNPNDYVDGPVLIDNKFRSFVGMHPIPVLHGCTVGELALMINGERWLKNGLECKLKVIPVKGWNHKQAYSLPIKPSPNLPNDQSIKLYPSLCLFEGTDISVGRGTDKPFQIIGYPDKKYGQFNFTPKSTVGMASNPLHKEKLCYGLNLTKENVKDGLNLVYITKFLKISNLKEQFFTRKNFFDKLAGTDLLRLQLLEELTEADIRQSWEGDLKRYKKTREKYLLYNEKK